MIEWVNPKQTYSKYLMYIMHYVMQCYNVYHALCNAYTPFNINVNASWWY